MQPLLTHAVPLADFAHQRLWCIFAACVFAGVNASIEALAINTGNLILRNTSLTSQSSQQGTPTDLVLNCTQPVDVPVGGQLRCTAVSNFDQDGMESGDRIFNATGQSFTLETATNLVTASPGLTITTLESRQLLVDVLGAQCTRPARMREYHMHINGQQDPVVGHHWQLQSHTHVICILSDSCCSHASATANFESGLRHYLCFVACSWQCYMQGGASEQWQCAAD